MAYWSATQLQPHRERVVEHFLQQFGFEVYLPQVGSTGVASAAASRRERRTSAATALRGSSCNGTA
jgi:hypothetical protein